MKYRILEALTERGYQVESLEEARQQLSQREILEILLDYEGIIGYTNFIIQIMTLLEFIPQKCMPPASNGKLNEMLESAVNQYGVPLTVKADNGL